MASELSGARVVHLSIPSKISSLVLFDKIVEQFGLKEISNNILLALNEEYIVRSSEVVLNLREGDEVAVIPPISGGDVIDLVKAPECGAVSIFVGITRNNFNGKEVKSLKYEAYESMAIKMIETICKTIREKWSTVYNIAIYHRLGEVKISENSVIIGISSPHRVDSIEAVTFAIDMLKTSVPIWKKEEYSDSTEVWKVNKECSWGESSDKIATDE